MAGTVPSPVNYSPTVSEVTTQQYMRGEWNDTKKIRALLERPYLKGRDIYDIWFLRKALQVDVDKERILKKLAGYKIPFTARRRPSYFLSLPEDQAAAAEVSASVRNDLQRFLPLPALSAITADNGMECIQILTEIFNTIDLHEM